VRRGTTALLITAGLLALPASALARMVPFTGDIVNDPSPSENFSFVAAGKLTKKGKLHAKSVQGFNATVTFSCFDAVGNRTSSKTRSDLPLNGIGTLQVAGGSFMGQSNPAGASYAVTGTVRKKTASGTLTASQGQKGTANYCTTGTFDDPTVTWTAALIPPVCGRSAVASGKRGGCVGP
jgi:hypothetical protein